MRLYLSVEVFLGKWSVRMRPSFVLFSSEWSCRAGFGFWSGGRCAARLLAASLGGEGLMLLAKIQRIWIWQGERQKNFVFFGCFLI